MNRSIRGTLKVSKKQKNEFEWKLWKRENEHVILIHLRSLETIEGNAKSNGAVKQRIE